MAETREVVIVGAGHNGLITAFYLARAGFRPLVLERRPQAGGCAITEEIYPGFRCSKLAHATGPVDPEIVADMNLASHGLKTYTPAVRVLSLAPDGNHLALYSDTGRTQQEIAKYSIKEAANYSELQKALANIAAVLDGLLHMTPPDIDAPASSNVFDLLKTGRKIRGLDEKDFYRLFRWMPMAVADLVAEWFDTELLRATIAAQGIFGTFFGPWSAGSGATLLLRAASDGNPAGAASYVMGGTGALSTAMAIAAQAAGVESRTNIEVAQIKVKDGAATGVVLGNGDEIDAPTVISSADPKRTLLGFVEPQHLTPSFLQRLQNYRVHGTVAKVNLALSSLPPFKGVDGNVALLGGSIQISPEIDYIERAFDASKYG
ncbi:MAG TPA: NAD(P)/FAD-dependent oxidoreductase, partial [Terriglobales bacterium]